MDLPTLMEESEERDSLLSGGSDFGQSGGLTPIAESEEGAETPSGYFKAYGVKELNGTFHEERENVESPFPIYDDPSANGVDLGQPDEAPIDVVAAVNGVDEISRPSAPIPNGAPADRDRYTPGSRDSDRAQDMGPKGVDGDSKETSRTVHIEIKDADDKDSLKEQKKVVTRRTDYGITADPSDSSISLGLRTPDDSTRRGTPDSFRSASRASEDMDRVRTPLIVANIGVMNLDEDIEVNLSNTLTLPGLKQGPHFMVGSPSPSSNE
jgi:hypothetical protein